MVDKTAEHSNYKISEIECLRAVAILFTLFHHSVVYLMIPPNQNIMKIYEHFTFWGGVDLFFVISGFVIMKSFSKSLMNSNMQYGSSAKIFWIKRAFRILPPAWFWLIVYLLATKYTNYTGAFGDLQQNLKDSMAALFQYANIYGLNCWGTNGTFACGPNGIYWSLSLEEQFYILLPIVIFLFRKYLTWLLLIAGLAQVCLRRPAWEFWWAVRTDTLIWGVLIAVWSQKISYKKYEPKFLGNNLILRLSIIILSVFGMAYLPADPNQILIGTGLLGLICAVLVWLSSYDKGYLFGSTGMIKKIMVWLGTRSYSLYLIHVIVFRFTLEIFYQLTPVGYRPLPGDFYKLLAISIPILFIIGELSYRFIEQPFRKLGLKLVIGLNPTNHK